MPPFDKGATEDDFSGDEASIAGDDVPAGDDMSVTHNHTESKLEEDVDAKEQLKSDLNDQIERTSGKRARKAEEKAVVDETSVNGDEDDEEEDGEPVFEVNFIVDHKHYRGKVLYRVRWANYGEEDDTYEPESNLLPQSRTALAAYHHKVGGDPATNGPKRAKSKSNLKAEHTPEADTESTPPASKRQKRSSTTRKTTAEKEPVEGTWLPNKTMSTWEDLVEDIETVERDPETGVLRAYIRFKNGKQTKVTRNIYFDKCPRAMLKFYENHLSV